MYIIPHALTVMFLTLFLSFPFFPSLGQCKSTPVYSQRVYISTHALCIHSLLYPFCPLCHTCTCACMCVVTLFYVVYECMLTHAFIHVFVPGCFLSFCVLFRWATSVDLHMVPNGYSVLANRLTNRRQEHQSTLIPTTTHQRPI